MKNVMKTMYGSATKRLFLLDYDGTLANLMPTPPEAKPSAQLLELLAQLASDQHNTVVIISGRKHEELDAWLGGLPVAFAAEHGLLYKELGQGWQPSTSFDTSWKPEVRTMMETYTAKLKGTLVEEKTAALVWHRRAAADPQKAQTAEKALLAEVQKYAATHNLSVTLGSKIIEVQPAGYDKGAAAKHWLYQAGWDFILAAGDDATDENLFRALPPWAITIKIGSGDTAAKLRFESPVDMRLLLTLLVND